MGGWFIFVPDSGTQKALSVPHVLSRHACSLEGGIIIIVPIFQIRQLRLSELIKFSHLYTLMAKQKPRATVLNLCIFASHPLGVVGGDLAPMLRQKQAIFTLTLKKVRKTTRTFSSDLNQIPYDYIVEKKKRFKGLGLVACRTMDGSL